MKKRTKIVLPLLLVLAMVLTALSVFIFTATAANADEASFAGYTIAYGADTSKESYGYETGTTLIGSAKNGSFASIVKELAALAPTVNSRYILNLKADVTVDTAFTIGGNEHTEVWINLNGHTITSTVDGPMIIASGSGAKIRVFGGSGAGGDYGSFKASGANAGFVKILSGSSDYVDIYNVDFSFSETASGTAAFIAEGGKINFEHSSVTNDSGNRANMFDVKGATLNLKYSTFMGDKSVTLVNSSASDVYIEGGELIGYSVVTSDDTASDIIVTGLTCEVDTAFVQGSADTRTYVLGSMMEIYTAIASGAANASNLTFYYGDGSMSIVGHDMSAYGIANSDVFTVTEAGGVWTMEYVGNQKAMATVAVIGEVPVVAFYSTPDLALETSQGGVGTDMRGATASTVRIVTLLADYSSGASGATSATFKGSENASLIFDINGHNLTYNSSDTKGSTTLSVSFDMHVTVDGADVSGNVGTFNTACRYARFIYARQSSNSGQISYHLVNVVKNLNIVASALYHADAAKIPVITLTCGYGYLENLKMTYTGTTTAALATETCQMIGIGHSSFKKGTVYMNGVTVTSTSTNALKVRGVVLSETWNVFIDGYRADGVSEAIYGVSGANVNATDLNVNTKDKAFAGAGKIYLTDAVIHTATGNLCSGSIVAHIRNGGEVVVTTDAAELLGTVTPVDGYSFVEVSEGRYEVVSGDFNHSITMPAVFSNGMMLQRGKVVNIYGYCKAVGDTISVKIGDVTGTGTVGDDKSWKVSFPPMAAAEGVTIEIDQVGKGEDVDVTISNVNIGEIWVMSGQSNASLFSGYLEDVDELALLSETLNIREFTSNGYSLNPDPMGNGSWKRVTASVVKEKATYAMSAAGYATVAKLSAELGPDVPVGLITIAQGSTKINTWLDYENIAELSPWLAARYDSIKANGTLPSGAHGGSAVPTILYNRHVYPLEGFTAAGVMWYQGCGDIPGKYYKESDAGDSGIHFLGPEGKTYTDFFTKLEDVFRRAFDNGGTELPFYVMQLAPYSRSGDGPGDGSYIYSFRLEQYEMCKKLDNTYLVSIANEGMAFTSQDVDGGAFIHPARKSPIGNRTADMILANHYNIKNAEVVSYPVPLSAVMNANGTVTVTFDTELKLFMGDTVEGFELYNGTAWVKASGVIDGNKLILSAPGVSSAKSVRYGFGSIQVELENGRIIEVTLGNYKLNSDKTVYDVTDALTGEHVFIDVDSNDVIRTKNHGNITNASGVPLVLFQVDVAAE